jgi:hypothetical protein
MRSIRGGIWWGSDTRVPGEVFAAALDRALQFLHSSGCGSRDPAAASHRRMQIVEQQARGEEIGRIPRCCAGSRFELASPRGESGREQREALHGVEIRASRFGAVRFGGARSTRRGEDSLEPAHPAIERARGGRHHRWRTWNVLLGQRVIRAVRVV